MTLNTVLDAFSIQQPLAPEEAAVPTVYPDQLSPDCISFFVCSSAVGMFDLGKL